MWSTLENRLAFQSKSCISHLKRQLQTLNQGSQTCAQYLQTAKSWADQLVAVGKTIDDDDRISYVIGELYPSFNSFVTIVSFNTRDEPLTFYDFQNELMNHEMLTNQRQPAV